MIQIYSPDNADYSKNGTVLLPTSCELNMEINSTWSVELINPLDDRFKNIVENAVLSVPTPYGQNLFRITQVDKTDTEITAIAVPIFLDAQNDTFIYDQRPTDKNGQEALDILMNGTKYKGHSDIDTINTAYYVMKNLIECIASDDENSFLNRWGGEIRFDDYDIYINERLGDDNGARVEFGFNLSSIQESIDMTNVATKIIPVAYNGYTLPNQETVNSPNNLNKYPIYYIRQIQYDDIKLAEDAMEDDEKNGITVCDTLTELYQALRTRAAKEFDNGIDLPSITYQVDMVDLEKTLEYAEFKDLVKVNLGDTVHVRHRRLDIETEARIIALTYDCIKQKRISLTIGDFVSNYFNKNSDITSSASQVINTSNNTLLANKIAGVINLLNTSLRAQKDVAQKQDVRAILFEDLDPSSPTFGALCIGTQGIQISKERNETNTDWVWGTAINFESIIADYIITGILSDRLGKNSWNLDTGVLKTKDIVVENGTFSGTITGSTIIGSILNSDEGNIAGFEITDEGFKKKSVIQLQKVYTESDIERIQGIIMGTITPTSQDYQLYDVDGDGRISAMDFVRIEQFYVPLKSNQLITELTINCEPYDNSNINAPVVYAVIKGAGGDIAFEMNLSPRNLAVAFISTNHLTTDSFNVNNMTLAKRISLNDENGGNEMCGEIYGANYNGSANVYIRSFSGYLAFCSNNHAIYHDGSYIDDNWSEGAFYPGGTGHVALGKTSTSNRWYRLYANNASSESSDERLKDNMVSFDQRFIKFYEMIEPIIYNWKDDKNLTKEAGYSAQKVISAMKECGISKDEFCCYEQDEKGYYSLIYRHFQILSHYYILEKERQHKEEIESLERRISILEEAMNK